MSLDTGQGSGGPTRLDQLRAEAEQYRAAEAAICRLGTQGKEAKDYGWTTRSFDPDGLTEADNLGIVCGYPSAREIDGKEAFLVCVDLDAAAALERADEFLPQTGAIEGRAGKPRSHRFYRVFDVPDWAMSPAPDVNEAAKAAGRHPGPWKKSFRHKETKETLIDFQGSGGQTAVPPSVHESGEARAWEPGGGIEGAAVLPFDDLWRAVEALAIAVGGKPVRRATGGKPPKDGTGGQTQDGKASVGSSARVTSLALVQGTGSRIDVPMDERVRRAQRYIGEVDLAESGFGGHDTTYRVARLIVNDFAVDEWEPAVGLVRLYNEYLRVDKHEVWSEEEIRHKVRDALQAGPDLLYSKGCKLVPASDPDRPWYDPTRLAEEFLAAHPCRFWGGRFWRYTGTHYAEVDLDAVKARLWGHLDAATRPIARRMAAQADGIDEGAVRTRVPTLTKTFLENVLLAVKSAAIVADRPFALNTWLTGEGHEVLAVENGLLDVREGRLRAHTPDYFGVYCLPYGYDPAADCPVWKRTVGRVCGGDPELVALFQEWAGYCLTTSTDFQKFLVLMGEGGNGKSTLIGGLVALLGEENVSHVPLERFDKDFDLGSTLGKLLNVADDMSEVDKAAEGVLKTFASGGRMGFNQKYARVVHAQPTAKLMFAANTPPTFSDRTHGIWRRLLLVPCTVTIPPEERVHGLDKAGHWVRAGELPGMLNWAVEGLRRLLATGRFTEPAAVRAAVDEHRRQGNPVLQFLDERVAPDPGGFVPSDELYQAYRTWCSFKGYKHPMPHGTFGREVRRHYPKPPDKPEKPRVGGVQTRGFWGIRRTWDDESGLPIQPNRPTEA